MNHRKIEAAEAPLWHNLDKPPVAQQIRLHHRRKVADAGAREQCVRKASVIVHREIRFERQSFLVPSVRINKAPAVFGLPMREREQPMPKQILRCFGWLAVLEIRAARYELMPVGQDPPRDERRVPEGAEPEHEVDGIGNMIDEAADRRRSSGPPPIRRLREGFRHDFSNLWTGIAHSRNLIEGSRFDHQTRIVRTHTREER
jgi:hypothetical protein